MYERSDFGPYAKRDGLYHLSMRGILTAPGKITALLIYYFYKKKYKTVTNEKKRYIIIVMGI